MDADAALALADALFLASTGEHLNDLQQTILCQVWQGQKYLDIAAHYGCTEGHAKDIGSQLWQQFSQILGEKVHKSNFRSALERRSQITQSVFEQSAFGQSVFGQSAFGQSAFGQSAFRQSTSGQSISVLNSVLAPDSEIGRNSSHVLGLENPNFIGRADAIAHLNQLVDEGSKAIVIQGEGGLGKTTLAQQYLKTQGFDLVLELLMAKEPQNIASVERVVEEWLKRDFNEEPGREFGVTLGRLKRQLHQRRVGVLIDNLEPALDKQGRLIEPHRHYVELFRVLADFSVQSVTLITSRDRLCEVGVNVEHYRLPGLEWQAWQQFFASRDLYPEREMLQKMHQAFGGNAKAMGILCGLIREDFEGDAAAYWQENSRELFASTDLKNLVASQFDRLQTLDPEAYGLLCRLGCYRYQDVSTVPTAGLLCLLWDVEASRRRQAIRSLRNRSLVECCRGEYWLHPALREEAIGRLRGLPAWKKTNREAAEFWTQSITTIETVRDAIQALESYYHFVEIEDFEQAGATILNSRNNQWKQFLPLGSTLYRMGLLQPPLNAITGIIERVQSERYQAELNNILGDLYWITGKVHRAIACQEKTIAIASQKLQSLAPQHKHAVYYFRMLKIDSLFSIGLYKVDLWELEAAATLFQQVIALAQNTEHDSWAEKASVCLALVHSYLGFKTEACTAADKIYDSIVNPDSAERTGRFAYFIQILGQTYKNAGAVEKALEMYRRAIAFADASHYLQVKAKALSGLAEIHREQGEWELALAEHRDAIALLDRIGAQCDLAEAYFQWGLTCRQLDRVGQSREHFERAMQLFAEMDAPRQVEKIKRQLEIRLL